MADSILPARSTALPLILFIVLASVAGFYNLGGDLMNDDEGTYLYSAWRISAGDAPYADFKLVQTPLSFLPTAALFKIVGPSVLGARILSYLFVLGAALLVYASARRFLRQSAWASAASAAMFLFTKHIFYLGRSFMPDDLMLLAAAAALYLFLRADENGRPGAYFAAGVLAGMAALSKLNGALVFAGFFLYLAWSGWRGRPSLRARFHGGLWLSAGFVLAFGLPFAALLAFVPGAAFQTITFHAGKKALAEGTFFTRPFIRLVQFVGNHNYGLVPVAAAGAVLWPGPKAGKKALLLFAAAAPFAVLFLPGRFFIRYAVCAMVPLALFFGSGLESLARWKKGRIPALTGAVILVSLSLAPTFQPSRLAAYDFGTRALVGYIQERTDPGASIFGDDPFINFLARRPCPGRLVDVSEAWTKRGLITADDIRRECEKAQTALIFVEKGHSAHHLVSLPDYSKFQAYLDEKYRLNTVMKREFLDVEIYLRKSP